MACPSCRTQFSRHSLPRSFPSISRRAFRASSPRQKLGAATYQQEWQTGAYHYNKQTTKNHPVAAQTANKLLEAYVTMQRRQESDRKPTLSATRSAIAARRRSMGKMFVSPTVAKDFGDKVVVDAVLYNGALSLQRPKPDGPRPAQAPNAGGAGAGADQQQRRRRPGRGFGGNANPGTSSGLNRFQSPRVGGGAGGTFNPSRFQGSRTGGEAGGTSSPNRSQGPRTGRETGGGVIMRRLQLTGPRGGAGERT